MRKRRKKVGKTYVEVPNAKCQHKEATLFISRYFPKMFYIPSFRIFEPALVCICDHMTTFVVVHDTICDHKSVFMKTLQICKIPNITKKCLTSKLYGKKWEKKKQQVKMQETKHYNKCLKLNYMGKKIERKTPTTKYSNKEIDKKGKSQALLHRTAHTITFHSTQTEQG